MTRQPTIAELYDAILNVQGSVATLAARVHELDEDVTGLRIDTTRRFDRLDRRLGVSE
jgi:hypothetical protein